VCRVRDKWLAPISTRRQLYALKKSRERWAKFTSSSEVATVSFQVTILKVLAGQPEGHLSLADLRNNVAILISSGPDWTDRTKRIAARTPGLDIFSQGMVLRSPAGWRITDAGRAFLAECEAPLSSDIEQPAPEAVDAAPTALPAAAAVVPEVRRRIWWGGRRRREKRKGVRIV
jgi:hypothetical protein